MPAILEGMRVLDFGHYIAGPFCAALLADLGADVIRVERPRGGDDRFLMPATPDGVGAMFIQANRGKRAITLDYGKPRGREIARKLIAASDIVVANFSAGALSHFGLDYGALKAIRPDIILTTIGAFAKDSELRDAIGFDGVGQAVSGAIYLTGEPGRPYRSATSYVDFSTAISAAFGTLAALVKRLRTGQGSEVEATLVGTALNIMNPILIEQATGANIREPIANRSPIAGPSDIFAAKDGWFIMQVIGRAMFKRWTELVARPDLLADPRFADDALRGRNGAALSEVMAGWAAERTRDECLAQLTQANITASPILKPADVVEGALGLAKAYLQPVDFGDARGLPIVRSIARIDGDGEPPRRPPMLGEHTDSVLQEHGYTPDEIAALRSEGVI